MSAGTREVVVGRIGRPHGIRGELSVEPRTDEPERRFVPGAVLTTEAPRGAAPAAAARPQRLTVRAVRWHQDRLLVTFEELADRTAAESARGLVLLAEVPEDARPDDPEEFYDHQLVGLRVVTTDGHEVGEVRAVVHGAAQDLLAVRTDSGPEALVPFVTALVPEVDLAGRRVVVADRPGLLTPLEDEA
jgi:16S rRNA processing protein RimM